MLQARPAVSRVLGRVKPVKLVRCEASPARAGRLSREPVDMIAIAWGRVKGCAQNPSNGSLPGTRKISREASQSAMGMGGVSRVSTATIVHRLSANFSRPRKSTANSCHTSVLSPFHGYGIDQRTCSSCSRSVRVCCPSQTPPSSSTGCPSRDGKIRLPRNSPARTTRRFSPAHICRDQRDTSVAATPLSL